MSRHLQTITVHVRLSPYGDALIYGSKETYGFEPGLYLKQLLFAWHEASTYGTELEIQHVENTDVIVLPAEQVIGFWAEPRLLAHVGWEWDEEAAVLKTLASLLAACLEQRKYHPDFAARRAGKLQWTWDEAALETLLKDAGKDDEKEGENARQAFRSVQEDDSFLSGLRSAFSAAVDQRYYNTEEEAADLRSEFPGLFDTDPARIAGMNEQAWLISVGWKADTAPFRPILQLLEPHEAGREWRLQLRLQDKQDAPALFPIRLGEDGQASGSWPEPWTAHVRERSAGWLERLRAGLPPELLAGGDDVLGQPLDDAAAWRFLKSDSERLLEAGWQVLLPAWWESASRRKPRLRAKVRSRSEDDSRRQGPSLFGLDSIIDFDWRIAIGDADLSESEFKELISRNERLVRFRGQWLSLDPAFLAQIRRAMDSIDSSQGLSFQDVLQLHLLGNEPDDKAGKESKNDKDASEQGNEEPKESDRVQIEVELSGQLVQLFGQLSRREEWPLLPAPSGLEATLRSYQHEGFAWLAFLRRLGLGACLADDMGLGKTVQLIAYLLHIKENPSAALQDAAGHAAEYAPQNAAGYAAWPALIICPTSVLGNWQRELRRFAPSLRILLHYGSGRHSGETFYAEARQADVVLTSYATSALDQELLQTITWEAICLDEAQNIKNAQTKQSAAVRSLPARHRIALTGTPIENRLSELWSIYDFITPGYLGTARAFQARFAGPIEKDHDERRTADLKKLVNPFLLRRKKNDPSIQLDLPDKNEMKSYVHLTAEQGALYDQTVNQLMQRMQKLEGIARKGAILSALTELKQLCDHPVLLTKESLPGISAAPDDELLDYGPLIERSSKLERLLAMVKELREEGERCLIFTQYIGMGQLLKSVLEHELQEPVLYLNGSTSKSARDKMIEQFQSGGHRPAESEALAATSASGSGAASSRGSQAAAATAEESGRKQPGVFILSLKAGGVGLNLTAANHVFHFDRWWNPAVENQATDRAYRMGQTRDVQVHKFICLGTLEERIDEMLESKQQLSDNVISSTEGWITELSTDELRDLFTLRREWTG
ncbi:DEAD/DEAH box helicase [Paenibacillus caui]|uniref:DEAD/DEAH box helicase n=1 Tax=Paenibacillus caui TaxID=2873927 RepID=UPI001CA8EC1E|nr:DEAD/DEAH box helicase [Paenibacillus caui]